MPSRPKSLSAGDRKRGPDLLQHNSLAVIGCDQRGAITSWNDGAARLYGWTRDEAINQPVDALLQTVFPAPTGQVEDLFEKNAEWNGELVRKHRDGSDVFVASHWSRGKWQAATRTQVDFDLTARRQAEELVRQRSESYQRLVDDDPTGNVVMRPNGDIVTCNPAFAQMFGFDSVESAQSANVLSLLRSRKEGAELLAAVREQKALERHELEMRREDGEPVYVVARIVGRFLADGQLENLQVYLFNDTKRKLLEQQLIQRQKMESLGTLAGGIAHDFNNILAIILGYASRIETLAEEPEQLPVATKVIKEAVERGAALVQQLLTAARQGEANFSSVDMNALVFEAAKMLQSTFPKTINFDLRLHPNLALVKADRSQLHQVLLNLCVNARDAMPDGGTLTIQTATAGAEAVAEHFTGVDGAEYALIRVIDTGIGIPRDAKSHIFEPFFTTKERGKGTGLGLSVVYGVVNNHRGFVDAE
ncbi:MAG: ATP-binding protein, partial [Verrucomicrobiota bacterium]|nr:ATP-binding protein [Verrucomicrobiota bacterium]